MDELKFDWDQWNIQKNEEKVTRKTLIERFSRVFFMGCIVLVAAILCINIIGSVVLAPPNALEFNWTDSLVGYWELEGVSGDFNNSQNLSINNGTLGDLRYVPARNFDGIINKQCL